MKTGIIGAMPEEVKLLGEHMHGAVASVVYGMEFVEGTLSGQDAVLVAGGVGKVSAALCACMLIERFGAERLVFTGVAGSTNDAVGIFDVVVSTDCVQHDYDVSGVFPDEEPRYYRADDTLRSAAVRAVHEAAPEVQLHEGTVASGDQFIVDPAVNRRIAETFGSLCCEMEGAAVAQVACTCGVPFVVIRAISDKADGTAEVDYNTFMQQAANRNAAVVVRLLELVG